MVCCPYKRKFIAEFPARKTVSCRIVVHLERTSLERSQIAFYTEFETLQREQWQGISGTASLRKNTWIVWVSQALEYGCVIHSLRSVTKQSWCSSMSRLCQKMRITQHYLKTLGTSRTPNWTTSRKVSTTRLGHKRVQHARFYNAPNYKCWLLCLGTQN